MTTGEMLSQEDFKKCAEFHGHICPGLAIGYRAARAGLEWLNDHRAEDEEIVAIVETDSCSVDAIQSLTGCTFGKGNLFYKDHGKQVFTIASRDSGRGVRIALKPNALELSERHRELIERMSADQATEEERHEFSRLHRKRCGDILEKPLEDVFAMRPTDIDLPPKARIEPSKNCARCGEPTMASKLKEIGSALVCRDCLE